MSVGNPRLCLVAALKDLSNSGGVPSKFKTLFIIFIPLNLSLNVFGAKNPPVHLLLSDCWCLPSKKVLFFIFFE